MQIVRLVYEEDYLNMAAYLLCYSGKPKNNVLRIKSVYC